jgi:predicted ATP-grasp superfamily ATP-dependent carboligase
MLGHNLLSIDVTPLRQKGEEIRRQMEELIKVMLTQQEHSQMRGHRMYT